MSIFFLIKFFTLGYLVFQYLLHIVGFFSIIYFHVLIHIYKQDLIMNNPQEMIYHTTQPNQSFENNVRHKLFAYKSHYTQTHTHLHTRTIIYLQDLALSNPRVLLYHINKPNQSFKNKVNQNYSITISMHAPRQAQTQTHTHTHTHTHTYIYIYIYIHFFLILSYDV